MYTKSTKQTTKLTMGRMTSPERSSCRKSNNCKFTHATSTLLAFKALPALVLALLLVFDEDEEVESFEVDGEEVLEEEEEE
jgi:hypothetical protein